MSRTSFSLAAGLAALLASGAAQAVPTAPFPVTLRNADGTAVPGRLHGDEFLSWAEDLEGFPLAWDAAVGAWHYATLGPDGRLLALPYRAGEADPHRLSLARHLTPTVDAARAALQERAARARPAAISPRGSIKNLVFLVKFNCSSGCDSENQSTTYTPAAFDPVFNGASGSVKAFYSEVSYGALTLQSTVADNAWIQLPNNDSYYAWNESANGRPDLMIKDAVAALDAKYSSSGGFPFAQYDSDGDHVIDAVDVVHVGPGYEYSGNPRHIHSHYSALSDTATGEFTSRDGTRFVGYHTEPELRYGGGIVQIGAICHETAHFFGAPDLYDYNGVSAGLGDWSLMAAGSWCGPSASWGSGDGTVPCHPDAYTKQFLGFTTPTLVTASGAQSLAPAETAAQVLKIKSGMPGKEYFLVENRQKTGSDAYLPGSGLAIYHVDEANASLYWNGSAWAGWNLDPDDYLSDLEQADGARHLNTYANSGDSGDLFTTGDTFGPSTTPSSKPYASSAGLITVGSITRSGTTYSFQVTLGGGSALGQPCATDAQCQSGSCADGYCCNAACDLGACDGCSVATGAPQNGTCTLVAAACDDKNPCTLNDRCSAGVCAGTPKDCGASGGGGCTSGGTCNLLTGACEGGGALPDDTACDDGDACTTGDTCQSGSCVSGASVSTCPAPDSCHEPSACSAGTCAAHAEKANGTACDDGDPCTTGDSCLAGHCLPATVVACPAPDSCHADGACNPATGACPTSFAALPNGTPCSDGNACTSGDTCQAGTCTGTPASGTCPATACRAAGTCDPTTGTCQGAPLADGTACDDGDPTTADDQCLSGTCQGTASGCAGKADGAACDDGNACTRSDFCVGQACVGHNPKTCTTAPDACHLPEGNCNRRTGACVYLAADNGTACDDGDPATTSDQCLDGTCTGTGPAVSSKQGCGCGTSTASGGPSALFALLLLSASILHPRRRAFPAPKHSPLPRIPRSPTSENQP